MVSLHFFESNGSRSADVTRGLSWYDTNESASLSCRLHISEFVSCVEARGINWFQNFCIAKLLSDGCLCLYQSVLINEVVASVLSIARVPKFVRGISLLLSISDHLVNGLCNVKLSSALNCLCALKETKWINCCELLLLHYCDLERHGGLPSLNLFLVTRCIAGVAKAGWIFVLEAVNP